MYLDLLWKFLKPISFSLIGKEVNFSVLDGNMVLYGAITLLIGVLVSETQLMDSVPPFSFALYPTLRPAVLT